MLFTYNEEKEESRASTLDSRCVMTLADGFQHGQGSCVYM